MSDDALRPALPGGLVAGVGDVRVEPGLLIRGPGDELAGGDALLVLGARLGGGEVADQPALLRRRLADVRLERDEVRVRRGLDGARRGRRFGRGRGGAGAGAGSEDRDKRGEAERTDRARSAKGIQRRSPSGAVMPATARRPRIRPSAGSSSATR